MSETYTGFHGDQNPPDSILRRPEFFPDYSYRGVYVDVGAAHPVTWSNSYHFWRNGWDVRAVEANPYYVRDWDAVYRPCVHAAVADEISGEVVFTIVRTDPSDPGHMVAYSALSPHAKSSNFADREVVCVPQRTLDSLFENEWKDIAQKVDILDIDIEWGEMVALRGLDLTRFHPRVILIEDHEVSASGVREYLEGSGYRHVLSDSYNHFYKRVDQDA